MVKHNSEGLQGRIHKNCKRKPHKRTSIDTVGNVKEFVEKFADNHALPLPGHLPAYKDYKVVLLPSDMTKVYVYRQYVKAYEYENQGSDAVISRRTFENLWGQLCPYVAVMKPATDLCFECQQNTSLVMRAANMPDVVKTKRLSDAQKHLSLAHMQRQHYNDQCEQAKQALEISSTNPPYMHYSFDFAQQIHFPYSFQQPGQLFFSTPRKCGIFGVACEPVSCQVNYHIDEADDVGKGANTTVSLVHDYLEKHGYKEPNLLIIVLGRIKITFLFNISCEESLLSVAALFSYHSCYQVTLNLGRTVSLGCSNVNFAAQLLTLCKMLFEL